MEMRRVRKICEKGCVNRMGESQREVEKQNVVQERDWALNKKEGDLSCTNQGKGKKDECGCEHV